MKTEIEFLEYIKNEFDTAHYGEGISFNLSNMSNQINKRLSELKKVRVADVIKNEVVVSCENCANNHSDFEHICNCCTKFDLFKQTV